MYRLCGLVEHSALGSAELTALWKKLGMGLGLATQLERFEGIISDVPPREPLKFVRASSVLVGFVW